FLRITRKVREEMIRVAVDRGDEDIGAVVEEMLRAVAVVDVEIEDGDLVEDGESIGGEGGVVEVAVAAAAAALGVVTGRPGQDVERAFSSLCQEFGAVQRGRCRT